MRSAIGGPVGSARPRCSRCSQGERGQRRNCVAIPTDIYTKEDRACDGGPARCLAEPRERIRAWRKPEAVRNGDPRGSFDNLEAIDR